MSDINVMVLGAGQEVGRSCMVVNVEDTYLMLDCGTHLGHRDANRFPNFGLLPFQGRMTQMISAVLITHFHLDHCAALPYLVKMFNYHGPIYTTHPTKAIMPIMLEDYYKLMTERQSGREWYSRHDIARTMSQVIGLDLNTATQLGPEITVTALYAGHVLGGAQFHINIHGRTIVYTGDYNTSADRHLGAAAMVSRLRPDLLISESTYGTTIRDSKKSRERDFLSEVLSAVQGGGKVLIPVFAVGRAQELLILVEDAWRRAGLLGKVPLYLSAAMTSKANSLYRSHVNWASQQLRSSAGRHTAFSFQHILDWNASYLDQPGPCLLFASPGMLNGGVSLEVFKAWAPHPNNLVVLPGYQLAGTVGRRLTSGQVSNLQIGSSTVTVRCKVCYLAFSAHADVSGILQLITAAQPKSVMLVHGDKDSMAFISNQVNRLLGIPCTSPPCGGTWVTVPCTPLPIPVRANLDNLLQQQQHVAGRPSNTSQNRGNSAAPYSVNLGKRKECEGLGGPDEHTNGELLTKALPAPCNQLVVNGVLVGRQVDGEAVDLRILTTPHEVKEYGLPLYRVTSILTPAD